MKLIFMVCEPVERTISYYVHMSLLGWTCTFEQCVFSDSNHQKVDTYNFAVNRSLYITHVTRWLKYFQLEQMHFVNGDEFKRNPVPYIKEVQKFLNLPIMLDENSFGFNRSKGFYCYNSNGIEECMDKDKGRKHPIINERTRKILTEFYKPYNRQFIDFVKQDFKWAV